VDVAASRSLISNASTASAIPAGRSSARWAIGRRFNQIVTAALMLGSLALTIYAGLRINREWRDLARSAGPVGAAVVASLLACAVAAEAFSAVSICRRRSGLSASGWRWSICWLVMAWIVWLALFPTLHQLTLEIYAGFACGLWAIAAAWFPRWGGRWSRACEATAWNLCLLAVGMELGLRATATLFPSPLFSQAEADAAEKIARFKFPAGSKMLGYTFNNQGYYDKSFDDLPPGRRRIAVASDSFGVGVVPYPLHFTTTCEKELPNTDVLNFGIAGIGPEEYAHLIRTEVLPLGPDAIVLCLFVGNDVIESKVERKRLVVLRSWLERDRLISGVLVGRLVRWASHWRGGAYWPPAAPCDAPPDGAALESWFPWLADPDLEQPSLSAAMHLQIEADRAIAVCGPDRRRYAHLFESLERIIDAAGDVPIAFCLIPDEFQIEDNLWRAVQGRHSGIPLDRDQPQRLIREWLQRHEIACLDLLEPLRAVPPASDGRRRLYHRQDTHFNARGNKVAGESLARFAMQRLAEKAGAPVRAFLETR
jgi:hypothetical protein